MKLLIDPNSNIEDTVSLKKKKKTFHSAHSEKKKCCYAELLVGNSRKIKGNTGHVQPFGLAQGNERIESIIVMYEARRKKT